jgi:hypothetical protein
MVVDTQFFPFAEEMNFNEKAVIRDKMSTIKHTSAQSFPTQLSIVQAPHPCRLGIAR